MIVLSVRQVTVERADGLPALREVGFDLLAGDILAVVGEDGSGRTTLTRVLAGHVPLPASGRLTLTPRDGSAEVSRSLADQDPSEGTPPARPSRWERIAAASPRILDSDAPVLTSRQQHADVLVIDDVPASAEALERLVALRDKYGFAMVVTGADPGGLREVADEVAVLYGGRIVEHGRAADLWAGPHHPHTVALFGRVPGADAGPAGAPGCPYRLRCAYRMTVCDGVDPALDLVTVDGGGTTMAACLQYDEEVRPDGPAPALLLASREAVGPRRYASPRDVHPRG